MTRLKSYLRKIIPGFFFFLILSVSFGQSPRLTSFSRGDSLRGYLNEFRSCYDVKHYDLHICVDIPSRSINGHNIIHLKALNAFHKIQLDLFNNLEIDSVNFRGMALDFKREANAFFVEFPEIVLLGDTLSLRVYYHGQPMVSGNPPWDGGFIWCNDSLKRNWIGVACEGTGASLWWPNKDHLSDEPESMRISIIAPDSLMAVSNGLLKKVTALTDKRKAWTWEVTYPINNYNVTLNLARYGYFQDIYRNPESDLLPLDYYVLDYNLDKAKTHFEQVKGMLACFEHYLGKFPFWNDGYTLVETPYWGMEHQSCIAYGNEYENNEFGFDFIIVHESAHEYWGNAVTVRDHAELWIHESFATYMESLYVEYYQGRDRAQQYLSDQREMINNNKPILGPLDVNYDEWNDADMYYKGSWMLHSIRNTLNDDSLWFKMLKATYQEFKYQNITTSEVVHFMDELAPVDLLPIFEQFLTTVEVPTLLVKRSKRKKGVTISYKWSNVIEDFNMPVKLEINETHQVTLYPTTKSQKILLPADHDDQILFDTDLFYYEVAE